MKKIILLVFVVLISISSSFSQDSKVKYQEINGHTYKFTYYENQKLQTKEEVHPIENSDKYRSLDYYEMYDEKGNMVFKGNKISGRQLTYYTNGKKKTQGMVMNSKTEGRKVYFDKEGNTVKVEIYRAGELIDTFEK